MARRRIFVTDGSSTVRYSSAISDRCEMGSFLLSRLDVGRAKTDGTLDVEKFILDSQVYVHNQWQFFALHSTTQRMLKDGYLDCSTGPGTDSKRLSSECGTRLPVSVNERGKSRLGDNLFFTGKCIFTHEDAFSTHNQDVQVDVNPHATFTCSYATLFCQCMARNNWRPLPESLPPLQPDVK
ncbi:hypothetical protein TNIN_141581 [Trichonephila inaurata madagascariensis]|uniref:Uncharacterized protein n=1 Tax=Trichonephila inaurata madagascariensis TaxID=2747483 RepID=A0A8X6WVD7_9ARAC|nr:hypothetical protein TNIN_141581 [Trichonephila inaurata madagascariensis]